MGGSPDTRFRHAAAALLFSALVLGGAPPALGQGRAPVSSPAPSRGVLVVSVADGGAGQRAGLQPGDLLLAWSAPAAPGAKAAPSGPLDGPLALEWLWLERTPRGPVPLALLRGGAVVTASLGAGAPGLVTLPQMAPSEAARLERARAAQEAGDAEGAAERFRSLAEGQESAGRFWAAVWLDLQEGKLRRAAEDWAGAEAALARAAARALRSGIPELGAMVDREWASALDEQGRPAEALAKLGEAVRRLDAAGDQGLLLAELLSTSGLFKQDAGDLDGAQADGARSLALREALAPQTLEVARSLNNLANVALFKGDLERAEALHLRSLALKERLVPESATVASTLHNLALVAEDRGDLPQAEAYLQRSLAIKERLVPDSPTVARTLRELGTVAAERGDLAGAEALVRRALALFEKAGSGDREVAACLNSLGILAHARGDFEAAESYGQRDLEISGRLSPESLDVALSLNNLGNLCRSRGELGRAAEFHGRALALREGLAPGSLDQAQSLFNLGAIALDEGDLPAAKARLSQALAIQRAASPGSLVVADTLDLLGKVRLAAGEGAGAQEAYREALDIQLRLAPGGASEAVSRCGLARVARAAGDLPAAAEAYRLAAEALEAQTGRLGGGLESRGTFLALHADTYREQVDTLLALGRPREAFDALERFRVRSLLAMMAERDLDFSKDAPPELLKALRLADAEYGRLQQRSEALDAKADPGEVEALQREREALRVRQRELREAIRAASPGLAALRYPAPVDCAAASALLGPGQGLLTFCVGAEGTRVIGLLGGRVVAYEVPLGREALAQRVRRFRALCGDPSRTPGVSPEAARDLGQLLLGPARPLLRKAQGLLIIPDGPLHYLPFAALRTSSGRCLVEELPLSYAGSASLLAELSRRPAPGAWGADLVAFGDPVRPVVGPGGGAELPGAGTELEVLSALWGGGGRILRGPEATEAAVRALPPSVRYLHFACHGVLDERVPLDSGLALSAPASGGGDGGLLQAWEVFEGVRVDAELVTLSACETGLGKEMGGEGLVGLTRAFQYAGARSVLSSLWSVSDEATAELMRSLYGHLRGGEPKARALREAQRELIRSGRRGQGRDLSHPFYWAAFSLCGPGPGS